MPVIPPSHGFSGWLRTRGLSLIELMVAMIIGIGLIAGVVQVLSATQQTYRMNESLSRIQESGRIALEILARDLRQAGFRGGCLPSEPVGILLDAGFDLDLFNANRAAVRGWENTSGPYNAGGEMVGYVAGTDTLLIRHAVFTAGPDGTPLTAEAEVDRDATEIDLTTPSNVPTNALVLVTDGDACDLFQNLSDPGEEQLTRSDNSTVFSKDLRTDASFLIQHTVIYYVGADPDDPEQMSLRRLRFPGPGVVPIVEDLVEGVVDMQVLYGVAATNARRVDSYVVADDVTDWGRVRAARISLLLRGDHRNLLVEPISTPFAGDVFTAGAGDLRMYRAFETTVSLRNELP